MLACAEARDLKEPCCTLGLGAVKHGAPFHVLFCDNVYGGSSKSFKFVQTFYFPRKNYSLIMMLFYNSYTRGYRCPQRKAFSLLSQT